MASYNISTSTNLESFNVDTHPQNVGLPYNLTPKQLLDIRDKFLPLAEGLVPRLKPLGGETYDVYEKDVRWKSEQKENPTKDELYYQARGLRDAYYEMEKLLADAEKPDERGRAMERSG